jgi:uncharacterized protein
VTMAFAGNSGDISRRTRRGLTGLASAFARPSFGTTNPNLHTRRFSGLHNRPMTFRIGIISDTHGLLRPEAERRLAGVDHIIHGGDIGRPEIIDALRRIAPVTAIRGNVDIDDWAVAYPETEVVRLARKSIYVLHDLKTLQIDPIARCIDVVVSGHSHVPKIDTADGVLYLNPGSAGRRRFGLPITLATIDVTPDNLRPEIHDLGDV